MTERRCWAKGCQDQHETMGLCQRHYRRWLLYRDAPETEKGHCLFCFRPVWRSGRCHLHRHKTGRPIASIKPRALP